MRKVSAWLRTHPWLASAGGIVAFCATLHLFLNWQAEQRWQRYAAEARARGVQLTLPEFARPEIPDEVNFAALPLLRTAFSSGGRSSFAWPVTSRTRPSFGDVLRGERIDWTIWQRHFQEAGFLTEISADPVRDTLRALDHYAPQFEQWSQWRTRPQCRFALDLEAGAAMPLPHLTVFMDASKVFGLKMRAHLAVGESAAGYGAFRENWQAYQALRFDPTLISGLVRISVLSTICARVGDGLMDRAWAEPELRQLDADFATVGLWEDYRLAMASERGFHNSIANSLAEASPSARGQMIATFINGAPALGTSSTQLPAIVGTLLPKRIYRDNQLRQNHYFDEMLAGVSADGTRFDPDRPTPSAPEAIENPVEQYYYFLNRISAPTYRLIEQRYLALKITLDQIRLAIALERHRLARGAYPEMLSGLVPEFCAELPRDIFSDGLYRYRRTDEGSFVLYSLGQNRRDDQGRLDRTKREKEQLDSVWLYAPPP